MRKILTMTLALVLSGCGSVYHQPCGDAGTPAGDSGLADDASAPDAGVLADGGLKDAPDTSTCDPDACRRVETWATETGCPLSCDAAAIEWTAECWPVILEQRWETEPVSCPDLQAAIDACPRCTQ